MRKGSSMQKFWNKWAPYWHICSALITAAVIAILWVTRVDAAANEVTGIRADVQEIKFNLKNIVERLGLEYIEIGERQP